MMGCQWGTKVIGRHVLLSYINYDIYFSHINNPYYGRRIIDAPPSQSIYLIFGQKDLFLSDIGYFFRQTDKMLKIIKSKKSNSFYIRNMFILRHFANTEISAGDLIKQVITHLFVITCCISLTSVVVTSCCHLIQFWNKYFSKRKTWNLCGCAIKIFWLL